MNLRNLLLVLAVLSVALSVVQAADTSGPTPDDLSPLYVEIFDDLAEPEEDALFSILAKRVKEEVEELTLPREVTVVRSPSRLFKDAPYIQLIITNWGLDGLRPHMEYTVSRLRPHVIDYACQISAKLFLPNGEKIDFESVRGIGDRDRNNSGLESSLDDALDKLKLRIVERFSPDTRGAEPPKVDE